MFSIFLTICTDHISELLLVSRKQKSSPWSKEGGGQPLPETTTRCDPQSLVTHLSPTGNESGKIARFRNTRSREVVRGDCKRKQRHL